MSMPESEVELLRTIVAATRVRLQAVACSVALLDGGELVFRAADGVGAEQVVNMRLPIGRGLAGYVVASGQALAVADVRRDQRFDVETAETTGYLPNTILAVPVEDDEGPIGVLEVLDRQPAAHDLEIAAAAARQVALTVQLAQGSAQADQVLNDPRLTELVGLLDRLRDASPADRALAASLLQALIDHRR